MSQIIGNKIQHHTKKIIHYDKVGPITRMPVLLSFRKYIRVIYYISITEENVIVSRDGEKAFEQTEHLLLTKALKNVQINGCFFGEIRNI